MSIKIRTKNMRRKTLLIVELKDRVDDDDGAGDGGLCGRIGMGLGGIRIDGRGAGLVLDDVLIEGDGSTTMNSAGEVATRLSAGLGG